MSDLGFLDHFSANDKHLSSLTERSGDAGSTGNAFVDKEIKNGPSGEALEFVSNNEIIYNLLPERVFQKGHLGRVNAKYFVEM